MMWMKNTYLEPRYAVHHRRRHGASRSPRMYGAAIAGDDFQQRSRCGAALELAAGTAARLDIRVSGDKVEQRIFHNAA